MFKIGEFSNLAQVPVATLRNAPAEQSRSVTRQMIEAVQLMLATRGSGARVATRSASRLTTGPRPISASSPCLDRSAQPHPSADSQLVQDNRLLLRVARRRRHPRRVFECNGSRSDALRGELNSRGHGWWVRYAGAGATAQRPSSRSQSPLSS
jgi:hypothetical protein